MECRHLFPNGQRCRCRATDAHVFCRHHAPQPRPRTLRPRGVGLGSWRHIQSHLATLAPAEVPAAILTLLSALLEDGPRTPSDRNAGALLRALLRRLGSVPFTLPADPAPEPDFTFEFSQSIDRLTQILQSRPAAPAPERALPDPRRATLR